jgi:hypothetical protein
MNRMKSFYGLALMILLGGTAQTQVAEISSEQIIANIIRTGAYSGVADKRLSWMGDAASVDVARVISDKELTPLEVSSVLDVLTLSFSAPKLVASKPDRSPRVALLVLKYLSQMPLDSQLSARIEETRTSLQNIAAQQQE